jgi:hypothetical protein
MLLIGMAKTGRVHDCVEGSKDDEDEENGTGNTERRAYGNQYRILGDLGGLALMACLQRGGTYGSTQRVIGKEVFKLLLYALVPRVHGVCHGGSHVSASMYRK